MEKNIENLRKILRAEADPSLSIDELANDDNFIDFGVDSLDRSSFFLAIEDNFGIHIPDEEIESLETLNAILDYIKGKQ
jgi:acyl carrier protein